MNIFFLNFENKYTVRDLFDKHLGKQILEIVQMGAAVCYRHTWEPPRKLDGGHYRPTHANHPMTLWMGDDSANFAKSISLALYALTEYRHRFGREHGCALAVEYLTGWSLRWQDQSPSYGTLPPVCVTPRLKGPPRSFDDVVEAYRQYYIDTKLHLFGYTRREPPIWLTAGMSPADRATLLK